MGTLATAVLLGFLLIGGLFCAATLHVQRLTGDPPQGAVPVAISANDGAALKGWWFRPAFPNGNCVLVLHGIGDSHVGTAGFAPMFLEKGYSVLVPDSRGHGASGGAFVTYGLLENKTSLAGRRG